MTTLFFDRQPCLQIVAHGKTTEGRVLNVIKQFVIIGTKMFIVLVAATTIQLDRKNKLFFYRNAIKIQQVVSVN